MKLIGKEILVYGSIDGTKIIGFIDELYELPDGTYCLVENKTKKSAASFIGKPWQQKAIYKSFLQLIAYSELFRQTYPGCQVTQLVTKFIFLEGERKDMSCQLKSDNMTNYLGKFKSKLSLYNSTHLAPV